MSNVDIVLLEKMIAYKEARFSLMFELGMNYEISSIDKGLFNQYFAELVKTNDDISNMYYGDEMDNDDTAIDFFKLQLARAKKWKQKMTKNEKKLLNKKIRSIKTSIVLQESEIHMAKLQRACFPKLEETFGETVEEMTNRHLIIEELKKELKMLEDFKADNKK